jgi:hypothetical protein
MKLNRNPKTHLVNIPEGMKLKFQRQFSTDGNKPQYTDRCNYCGESWGLHCGLQCLRGKSE